MPHVWSFHALNKVIDVEQSLAKVEETLGSNLTLHSLKSYSTTAGQFRRTNLIQDSGESFNSFILLDNQELQVPTLLAYAGDRGSRHLFLEWCKNSLGTIVYPIVLDQISMIEAAEAITKRSDRKTLEYHDSKFIFDVETQDNNLSKMEIEIPKESIKKLSVHNKAPYTEAIIPYLYQETGMWLTKLPLSLIALAGKARITKDEIITLEIDLDDELLETILSSIQLTPCTRDDK